MKFIPQTLAVSKSKWIERLKQEYDEKRWSEAMASKQWNGDCAILKLGTNTQLSSLRVKWSLKQWKFYLWTWPMLRELPLQTTTQQSQHCQVMHILLGIQHLYTEIGIKKINEGFSISVRNKGIIETVSSSLCIIVYNKYVQFK